MFKKMFLGLCLALIVLNLSFTISFAQTSQQISLKTGFNFLSFTLSALPAAAELKNQNPSIEEIYSYSPAAGSFLTLGEGTLTSLAPGKGYIVRANSASVITVNGSALAPLNNISLKPGFNLTGFSRAPEAITASQLMNKYPVLLGIYSWSANAGAFVSVIRNAGGTVEQPDGIDPTIGAGKAFFVNIATATTLNYDGDK